MVAFAEFLEQARAQGFTPKRWFWPPVPPEPRRAFWPGRSSFPPRPNRRNQRGGVAPVISRFVKDIAQAVLDEVGDGAVLSEDEVIVFDDYLGDGYGILNQNIVDAVGLVARDEGVLLDPVYTGKAMSGLLDQAGKGYFGNEDVVFIHTGGTPALFPYREGILEGLKRIGGVRRRSHRSPTERVSLLPTEEPYIPLLEWPTPSTWKSGSSFSG